MFWSSNCVSAWSREISTKSSAEEALADVRAADEENDAVPLWKEEAERRQAEVAAALSSEPVQAEAAGYPAASSSQESPGAASAPVPEVQADESQPAAKTETATKEPKKASEKKKTKAKAAPKPRSTTPTAEDKPKEEEKPKPEAPAASSEHIRAECDVSGLSPEQKQQECKHFAESTNSSGSLLYQMIDGQLAPVAHFVSNPSYEKFAKACYEHKFIEGRGTIGRTYHAKVPEFLQDARKASPVLMIRKKIAMAHGLKSFYCAAFGNGIIEVFSADVWGAPPALVDRPGA